MILDFFLSAAGLALSAVSIPGPLQAYLLNVALRAGWRRALYVAISPVLTDAPVIIVTVFVLGQLPDAVIQLIRLGGALFLLWLAWGAWGQYRQQRGFMSADAADAALQDAALRPRRVLLGGMAINLLSPGPYLFWSTITGPQLLLALEQSIWHGVAFLVGFYGTFVGGMVLLAITFDRVGRINIAITQALLLFALVLMVWFATVLLADVLGVATLHRQLSLWVLPVVALLAGWDFRRRLRAAQPGM